MNVENLRLNDLIPSENNAKKHDKKQINNPHLKRDYEKYLQKLYKRLKRGE